ncbi:DUF692 domain-containing protein [Rhizobiaceae bacterium]|nr:DUF692 domain-containing protein [Rhizobiaceae bacterium]
MNTSRAGTGFKPEHLPDILAGAAQAGFFEVHAENYMGAGGLPHAQLNQLREQYPLSLHGVGLSIGGEVPLDEAHLTRLASLNARYEPALFSEHLAWSTHGDHYLADLLPVPYDENTLQRVADHIDRVQEVVGRQMLLENPSTYVAFDDSTMSEVEFITQIARRTGCGLLLDVNNVFVASTNQQTDPNDYLARFPTQFVGEIHLAGHAVVEDEAGRPLLIDSHDREVDDAVWRLYADLIARTGPLPTLIEWDGDVPSWPVLLQEMERANAILDSKNVAA